jgi:hypothetical protein
MLAGEGESLAHGWKESDVIDGNILSRFVEMWYLAIAIGACRKDDTRTIPELWEA